MTTKNLSANLPSLQVSVITCRRPAGLRRLLVGLLAQRVDQCKFEILVVDNDAEGSAEGVVRELAAGGKVALNYSQESEPGIVFARNNCVAQFLRGQHDALVFIDDDEWPADERWLDKLVVTWQDRHADIVTGHVISVGEPGVPDWALQVMYGENRLREGDVVGKFYTNNLLIARHVLEKVQPAFDVRFAMTGASDYHFALKCTRAGLNAFYADAPVIEEFPSNRATLSWFLQRGFRSGAGHTRSHIIEEPLFLASVRALTMAAGRAGAGVLSICLGIISFSKKRAVLGMFRIASALGTLSGLLGITHEEYRNRHT